MYDASTGSLYNMRISSNYVGTELNFGRLFEVTPESDIDLYAKYIFMYQKANSFTAGSSDVYNIKSVTSHRVRLGSRYLAKLDSCQTLYAGLAFEHEFDGKARARVTSGTFSADIRPADIDGSRGVAEIGYKYVPEDHTGWHFDVHLKGTYGSSYRSAWAEADLKYMF